MITVRKVQTNNHFLLVEIKVIVAPKSGTYILRHLKKYVVIE